MDHYCHCKDCKNQRRKGRILGSRKTYTGGQAGLHSVSDYVPFHKFLRGRVRKERIDRWLFGLKRC